MKHYNVSITFETEAASEEGLRSLIRYGFEYMGLYLSDVEIEVEEVE